MMSQSKNGTLPPFARLIVIFGIAWAVIGFGILPLVIVMARNQGWLQLLKVTWLILPTFILLTSLGYWLAEKRAGAIADAIVSCGIVLVWLLVIILDLAGAELKLGLLPYILVVAILVFTILSFWMFRHTVSEDASLIRESTLRLIYWTLFIVTTVIIAVAYGLVLYFQIITG